ncbi:MAG TPA: glycosyltransferase [Bacilli bacterium]|jgi:lipopolysaccharide biosynthesis glycosyltransferase|nr:glycosyltransferase [Bacilli bacterium]
MNIVYAGNKNVFDGLLISLLSLIEVNQQALRVYVLTMDLQELDKDYIAIPQSDLTFIENQLKRVNQDSRIIRVDVKETFQTYLGQSKNLVNRYTPYALLRLLLDRVSIIPDKVLYLDTDTVINKSITGLYNTDIAQYEYAAVKDRYGRFFFNPFYCNTGVLLLNMAMIRKTNLFKKVVDLLNTKKVFLSDQTGINKMTKRKKILSRKFNEQKNVRQDTVIRHFSMQFRLFPKFHFVNIKPWHIDKVHDMYHCHEFDHILTKYQTLKTLKELQ